MPTTAENVTFLQRRVPNYSRAEILATMSELYEEIYSQNTQDTLYIDTSTGMPPYIATTLGTYTYNCPANCRETAAIFATEMPRTYSRTRPIGPRREYYFRDKGYYDIPLSKTTPIRPDGTLATVTFYDNPGTTTDQYYHLYYVTVTPLTTESVEMLLPDQTHRELRRAVLASLKAEDYGETGEEEAVIKDALRKIRGVLNRGAQGRTNKTPVPTEYQSYSDLGHYGRRL